MQEAANDSVLESEERLAGAKRDLEVAKRQQPPLLPSPFGSCQRKMPMSLCGVLRGMGLDVAPVGIASRRWQPSTTTSPPRSTAWSSTSYMCRTSSSSWSRRRARPSQKWQRWWLLADHTPPHLPKCPITIPRAACAMTSAIPQHGSPRTAPRPSPDDLCQPAPYPLMLRRALVAVDVCFISRLSKSPPNNANLAWETKWNPSSLSPSLQKGAPRHPRAVP